MVTSPDFAKIINKLKPFRARVSACIINMRTDEKLEYNPDLLLYPASAYKMFIGAAVENKAKHNFETTIKFLHELPAISWLYPLDKRSFEKLPISLTALAKVMYEMLVQSDNLATNNALAYAGIPAVENVLKENDVSGGFTEEFLIGEKTAYKNKIRLSGADLARFIRIIAADDKYFMLRECLQKTAETNNRIHAGGFRARKNYIPNTRLEKTGYFETYSPKKIMPFIRHGGYNRTQAVAAVINHYAVGIIAEYETFRKSKYFEFSKIIKELTERNF
jgi:beta-lactamase class A